MKDGVGGDEDSKEWRGAPVTSGNAVRGSPLSKRTEEGCSKPRPRHLEAPDTVGSQGVGEEIPLKLTSIAAASFFWRWHRQSCSRRAEAIRHGPLRAFAGCRQPFFCAGGYGGTPGSGV